MQSDLPRLLHPSNSPPLSRRPHCALPRLSELDSYSRTAPSASAIASPPSFASINARPHPLPRSDTATSPPHPNVPLTPPPTSRLHSPPVTAPTERENWSSVKTLPHNAGNRQAQVDQTGPRLPRISDIPPAATSRSESTSYPPRLSSPTNPQRNGSRDTDSEPAGSHSPCSPSSSACFGVVKGDSGAIDDAQTVPSVSPFKRPARPTTPPSHPSAAITTATPQSSQSVSVGPPNGNSSGGQALRYSAPPSPAETPKGSTKGLQHTAPSQSHMVRFVGRSNSAEAMPPPSSPSQCTADRSGRTRWHSSKNTTVPVSPSSIPAADSGFNAGRIATKLQPGLGAYPSHRPDGRMVGSLATLKCDSCKVQFVDGADALVMQFSPYPHRFQCQDCQAKAAREIEHHTQTQGNKRKSPPFSDSSEEEAPFKTRRVTPDRPPSAGREPDWFPTSRPSNPDARPQSVNPLHPWPDHPSNADRFTRLSMSAASEIFKVLVKIPETDEEISQNRLLRDTVAKLGPPQADRFDGTCYQ
ncbi:uncharacterized protein EI97DRAFT_454287 [Westerdykella ornata]|uniref:Uncharacterized protein n=1 Tax=Westerdykella ornata TaxID=318751 RepID=A0A6A6JYZ3_WESOR|nr:uncharacterized protein EI97DRAFT_454287 [Westerdykella ornata]KAF2281068.1 hypothetical protein EI97DRAFT_454287 [Westerdykella ornata]